MKKVPMIMDKIIQNRHRIIAFLITCLLMVIDWTRGSQAGEVWKWTVNMTGVLVVVLTGSAWGFDGYRKHSRIYVGWLILGPVLAAGTYYFWWTHQTFGYRDQMISAVVGVWSLGFLYIRLAFEVFIEKSRKFHMSLSQGLLMLMLIMAFVSVNEDIWPLYFGLFFFPVYQIFSGEGPNEDAAEGVERTRRNAEIRKGMIDAIICMFFIIQGHAFVLRPFDDELGRYSGFYANPNVNSLFYSIVYTAFLLRFLEAKTRIGKILVFVLSAGLWGFVLLTISKTGILAFLAISLMFIFFGLLVYLKGRAGKICLSITVFLVVAFISIPADYLMVRYLPPVFHHPIWFQGEYSEEKVHSWDPIDSEKYVSFDRYINEISGRFGPVLRLVGESINARAAENDQVPDQLFLSVNGRRLIWIYYLNHGTMLGHSNSEGHDLFDDWYVWHAQNMFVQFWYYYGIPAAILFAIWLVWTMAASFVRVLKAVRDERYQMALSALTAGMYLLLFAIYGLPEAVWYPGQFILFLAFFTPALLEESGLRRGRKEA